MAARRRPLLMCPGCGHRRDFRPHPMCHQCRLGDHWKSIIHWRRHEVPLPGHEERIALYESRAALGLPLFGQSDRQPD